MPTAQSLEAFVENRHASNFVSLVAPAEDSAAPLFKWGNPFSWSYAGDFADSIRERVKQAGGNVTGDCAAAWVGQLRRSRFPYDGAWGYDIYFGNKTYRSPAGGTLDVDMNAGRRPYEAASGEYRLSESVGTMREGTYRLFVHQYPNGN